MRILAGDIGGTKTWLQIVNAGDTGVTVEREERFDSRLYDDFLSLVRSFVERGTGRGTVDRACFGVAGPVEEGSEGQVVHTTNLPWHLEGARLSKALGIPKVLLINDFKATGYSIEALGRDDLAMIQTGRAQAHGPCMVLGAGTGLGVAQLVWCNGRYEVIASQGGHVSFAPVNDEQAALLEHLRTRHGHVSYEHVLSGPGLVRIYEFILATDPAPEAPGLAAERRAGDPAAAVAGAGLAGRDERARRALAMFADIYASQAGNLALVNLAFGGVYLAGGIAPKILKVLNTNRFREVFARKGPMAGLLEDIPVSVILNAKAGLLGAVQAARRL